MRDLYKEVTSRILAELNAGAAPWIKPWRDMPGAGLPSNAVSGRPYSGCNVVLLWSAATKAGYADWRFLTFKQALDLGGNVRKGERGTKVYFVSTFRKEVRDPSTGHVDTHEIPFLKEYTVFNVAQCENLRLKPRAVRPSVTKRDELADAFVKATGAAIVEGHGQACYRPGADNISMPAFEAFKSADHFYATEFHELGHWTGHPSRLDRDLRNRFGSKAYAAEELVAELTAAFLCAEFGYNGELRHAGYIDHWAQLLRDDDRAFFTAASKAQKAADYMRELALAEPVAAMAA